MPRRRRRDGGEHVQVPVAGRRFGKQGFQHPEVWNSADRFGRESITGRFPNFLPHPARIVRALRARTSVFGGRGINFFRGSGGDFFIKGAGVADFRSFRGFRCFRDFRGICRCPPLPSPVLLLAEIQLGGHLMFECFRGGQRHVERHAGVEQFSEEGNGAAHWPPRFPARYSIHSTRVLPPLDRLQASQASVRFEALSLPPRETGKMWSYSNGPSVSPQ